MSKDGLVKDVEMLRRLVFGLMVMVIVIGVTLLIDWAGNTEIKVEKFKDVGGVGVMMTLAEEEPTAEPVPDALVAATMKDYAELEAIRVAKMAATLLDMGGEFEASCDVTYDCETNIKTEYSICWVKYKHDTVEKITQCWIAGSWAECLSKMTAWKRGK